MYSAMQACCLKSAELTQQYILDAMQRPNQQTCMDICLLGGIANILSLSRVKEKYRVTFDSALDNCFHVHKEGKF
jgi:hypothetical protein